MIKGFVKFAGLISVCFALGCSGSVDDSEESVGGNGGTNAAGAAGQAGQGGHSTGGSAGTAGSSGQAGFAGGSGQGGTSQGGSAGSSTGGSAGEAGQAGSSGASGMGGTAGAAGQAGSSGQGGTSQGGSAGSSTGGSAGEAGQAGSAGGGCEPTVKVTTSGFNTGEVPIGSNDVVAFDLTLEATDCADIVVHGVDLMAYSREPDFIPTDVSWFCADDCQDPGDFAFSDAKYSSGGQTLMGPQPFKRYDAYDPQFGSAVKAHLLDEFTLKAGTSITGPITIDVSAPAVTPIVGKKAFIGLVALGAHRSGGSQWDLAKIEWNLATEESFKVVDALPTVKLSTATPPPQIVVGGKDSWVVFTEYTTDSDGQLKYAYVSQDNANGDWQDFTQVALAQNGQIIMVGTPDQSFNRWVFEPAAPIPFQAGNIQVWAKMANVVSDTQANGAWYGVARSGHTPSLKIPYIRADWNGFDHIVKIPDHSPSAMVLRKTKPYVTYQNLASNILFNGEVGLYRFQLAADAAGCVAFKQVAFMITGQQFVGFSNFRLYRGSSQVPSGDYHVVDIKNGTELISGSTETMSSTYALVNVSFTTEDFVCGSGYVYELRATASSVSPGKSVNVGLLQEYPVVITGVPTGNLINMAPETPNPWFFHVLEGNNTGGPFIWSDQSELPHSELSADWTNGYLVDAMGQTVTLAAY